MMRRYFKGPRALSYIACLLVALTGGCRSAPPSGTEPYSAPPREVSPDGNWAFKQHRLLTPSPSPSASPTAGTGSR